MNAALQNVIASSRKIAFLGGAGLSTESGIPDFRSSDGIYKARKAYGVPPEVLLSHDFFEEYPEIFFDYYRKNLLYPDAKPNNAHKALAKLEQDGKLNAVITQNIDNLHQLAGSHRVLELQRMPEPLHQVPQVLSRGNDHAGERCAVLRMWRHY